MLQAALDPRSGGNRSTTFNNLWLDVRALRIRSCFLYVSIAQSIEKVQIVNLVNDLKFFLDGVPKVTNIKFLVKRRALSTLNSP